MSKFNIGDVVYLRKDCVPGKRYNNITLTTETAFKGLEVVTAVVGSMIGLDNGNAYGEDCLELALSQRRVSRSYLPPPFHPGDIIKLREDAKENEVYNEVQLTSTVMKNIEVDARVEHYNKADGTVKTDEEDWFGEDCIEILQKAPLRVCEREEEEGHLGPFSGGTIVTLRKDAEGGKRYNGITLDKSFMFEGKGVITDYDKNDNTCIVNFIDEDHDLNQRWIGIDALNRIKHVCNIFYPIGVSLPFKVGESSKKLNEFSVQSTSLSNLLKHE